jgi:hypothetical protein
MERVLVHLLVEPPLAADGQRGVLDRNVHVVRLHAGQLDGDHELVLGLVDVQRRHPRAWRSGGRLAAGVRPAEQPVDLVLDAHQVPEGIPT